jgi:hypothetical protein
MRGLNEFMDMLHIYNNIEYGKIVLTGKCLNEDKRLIEVEGISNDVKIGDTLHKYQILFEGDKFCLKNKRDTIREGTRYKFVIEPIAEKRRFKFYRYTIELV